MSIDWAAMHTKKTEPFTTSERYFFIISTNIRWFTIHPSINLKSLDQLSRILLLYTCLGDSILQQQKIQCTTIPYHCTHQKMFSLSNPKNHRKYAYTCMCVEKIWKGTNWLHCKRYCNNKHKQTNANKSSLIGLIRDLVNDLKYIYIFFSICVLSIGYKHIKPLINRLKVYEA